MIKASIQNATKATSLTVMFGGFLITTRGMQLIREYDCLTKVGMGDYDDWSRSFDKVVSETYYLATHLELDILSHFDEAYIINEMYEASDNPNATIYGMYIFSEQEKKEIYSLVLERQDQQ